MKTKSKAKTKGKSCITSPSTLTASQKLNNFKGLVISSKELKKLIRNNVKCSDRTAYRVMEDLRNNGRLTEVTLFKVN